MSILSFLKSKLKISDPNDYDTKTNYQILKADFLLMIAGVGSYKGTPSKVFIRVNGIKTSYYVTYPKYEALKVGWDAFIQMNQREPNFITINKVVINKPAPFLQLEKNLQCTINSMDDFKAGIIASWKRNGGVYNHISCMQGATLASIIQGVNFKYNNCARWAYLSNYVAGVLGVPIKYLHVDCNYSNGRPDLKAGHYLNLLIKTNEKWDAAHYASSGQSTGTMCINGYNGVIDNKVPCP